MWQAFTTWVLLSAANSAGLYVNMWRYVVGTDDATLFAASRPRRLVLAKGQLVEDSRPTGRPAVEEVVADHKGETK